MKIKNGNVFLGKNFQKADVSFGKSIEFIGETDCPAEIDAEGGFVIPGLVDIHTHGAVGEDFSDGKAEGLRKLSAYYASRGVTSFLATTMTLPEGELIKAMRAVRAFRKNRGAKCAGVHLEGPFLSYEKRGAQAAEHLRAPDLSLFRRLNEACGGAVRMVTVAPENVGAFAFIREVSKECAVSLGHSSADYDTSMRAFEAGASHATHLFNAMPPLLHRAPGIIGAAFDSGASVELICDGLHIHPAIVRLAFQTFGERVDLVSDSIRCAGMPDGNYELGGQPVRVKEGKATLTDGTLAGSSISLMDAVRNAVKFGVPLENAVYAATTAPALAAGLEVGKIEVGAPADLVVLDKKLEIVAVFVDGERIA